MSGVKRWAGQATALAVLLTLTGIGVGFSTPAKSALSVRSHNSDRVRVIVATNDRLGRSDAEEQVRAHGGAVRHVYRTAIPGYAASVPAARLAALRDASNVRSVEIDRRVSLAEVQFPVPSWGLDRVDQRHQPLSGDYAYDSAGGGVTAYVFDTGVRLTHEEFRGRIRTAPDFGDYKRPSVDCNGHGTHVAGTTAGNSYGVAKQATLVAVRVLDCKGEGWVSDMIAAVDWINTDHAEGEPAVVNASVGGAYSSALNGAVSNSIADGIVWVVAAGNESTNACSSSPASVSQALTVAATNSTDRRAWFSNYGRCVDLFAPGVNITSAGHDSDSAVASGWNGTSMAAPHVAGAVARYLGRHPNASPAVASAAVLAGATENKVTDPRSSNRLLYLAPGITACTITGTDAGELLTGTAGDDVICGLGGDDLIRGEGGDDTIIGGTGVDTADYATASTAVVANLTTGTASGQGTDTFEGIESVSGSRYDDRLDGDAGPNQLTGGAGNDALWGWAGSDTANGGPGRDTIGPGAGHDAAHGGRGVDTAHFGRAVAVSVDLALRTVTGEGTDSLTAFENVTGSSGADTLRGASANNLLRGAGGADKILGLGGNDLLYGAGGQDALTGGGGTDTCNGGVGADTATTCEALKSVP